MSRISTRNRQLHDKALELCNSDILNHSEREFVLDHFHEAAAHNTGVSGAFFTPLALAQEFSAYCPFPNRKHIRILDLCAGIGALSYAFARTFSWGTSVTCELVCVEQNPDYVSVGKKVVPEATWVQLDVTDIDSLLALGQFDYVISNPPFGAVSTFSSAKRICYTGNNAAYNVLEIATLMAPSGCFILPQQLSGFKFSGVDYFQSNVTEQVNKFVDETGIILEPTCFSGCNAHAVNWKSKVPLVEFVAADFAEEKVTQRLIYLTAQELNQRAY
ncbi:methyltransferase [Thalassotalea marina]|uniref:Methyltransferase small domain-containing protein n=1 Tax=Thalassotalea marina TaxID=1673741 RepID=A0A919BSM6_9GAMM|nr:methyltransferase [Thalassotalea marina]GHG07179.1 hypothetical protein GCM10017161_41120 [Thalassotalea marina]